MATNFLHTITFGLFRASDASPEAERPVLQLADITLGEEAVSVQVGSELERVAVASPQSSTGHVMQELGASAEEDTVAVEFDPPALTSPRSASGDDLSHEDTFQESSLARIISTQSQINQIRDGLSEVIKQLDANPSMLARLTRFWGDKNIFTQITGGATLSLPFLIGGFLASMPPLVITGGAIAAVYTGLGVVLNDHHHHTVITPLSA